MKRIVFLALAVLAFTAVNQEAQAQNFLDKVKKKAVQKVEQKLEQKVDQHIDNQLDRVFDGNKDNDDRTPQQEPQDQPQQSEENTNRQGSGQTAVGKTAKEFVPGSVVIFNDNFKQDPVGEYPAKWEVLEGNVEIYTLSGEKCANIGNAMMRPFIEPDPNNYLGDEWTLEIEYYARIDKENEHDFVVFLEHDDIANTEFRFRGGDSYATGGINASAEVGGNFGWNLIQISFNKGAIRVYRNGVRCINRNRLPQYSRFVIHGTSYDNPACYVRRVTLCKGAQAKYEQQSTNLTAVEKAIQATGKFVTNNILFETGKAELNPESMAEIQRVADYMKKNPSVRFEVQGHCDNQGSDKVNDPLSQQRSEAIVKALVGMGVDEFNLKAVGKGSHEPVADNSTEAGRAKNRRVEFIKR